MSFKFGAHIPFVNLLGFTLEARSRTGIPRSTTRRGPST
jgi:hypothetical protein